MDAETTRCGYVGCPNPGESRLIERILEIGTVNLSLDMYEAHYDLRDIDDDVVLGPKGGFPASDQQDEDGQNVSVNSWGRTG